MSAIAPPRFERDGTLTIVDSSAKVMLTRSGSKVLPCLPFVRTTRPARTSIERTDELQDLPLIVHAPLGPYLGRGLAEVEGLDQEASVPVDAHTTL